MTKNTSFSHLASMAILSLACTTGCTLDLNDMKNLGLGDGTEEDSSGEDSSGSSSSSGSEGSSGSGNSATVPQAGIVYEGGTEILLTEPGIHFVIPEDLYGAGDRNNFDMGLDGWAGNVGIFGVEALRSDLDPWLSSTVDMGEGEYWFPVGDVLLYDDATVVDYLIEGADSDASHATIIALYGEKGITAVVVGVGVSSTIDDVIEAADSVAISTTFTTPAG